MNQLREFLDKFKEISPSTHLKLEVSQSMMLRIQSAIKNDALSQGFVFDSKDYLEGPDNKDLQFKFGFDTRATGSISFEVIDPSEEIKDGKKSRAFIKRITVIE